MRVLILGGTGMLGHKLWQSMRGQFDTWTTTRSDLQAYADYNLFDRQRLLSHIDAFNLKSVAKALTDVQPEVVINCIGIIKQLPAAKDPIKSITVNALFPHQVARLCQTTGVRLIHLSTDCVSSGRRGRYTEDDAADAEDLYGRSKRLGEVDGPGCLTIRTSIIGRELRSTTGLVEWFLSNRNSSVPLHGYTRAIFSGFTTVAVARIVSDIIERQPDLSGVYHVSSEPIAKYDLLCLLRTAYDVDVAIEPHAGVQLDRSLDSRRFRSMTGFVPPSWPAMIEELASDPTPYEEWRSMYVS